MTDLIVRRSTPHRMTMSIRRADEAARNGDGTAEALRDVLQHAVAAVVEHEKINFAPMLAALHKACGGIPRPAVAHERGDETGA
jgi:hypothetical protein